MIELRVFILEDSPHYNLIHTELTVLICRWHGGCSIYLHHSGAAGTIVWDHALTHTRQAVEEIPIRGGTCGRPAVCGGQLG